MTSPLAPLSRAVGSRAPYIVPVESMRNITNFGGGLPLRSTSTGVHALPRLGSTVLWGFDRFRFWIAKSEQVFYPIVRVTDLHPSDNGPPGSCSGLWQERVGGPEKRPSALDRW